MLKMRASDVAMRLSTEAVQLHGGYGYVEDFRVERLMRDAKITQIWEWHKPDPPAVHRPAFHGAPGPMTGRARRHCGAAMTAAGCIEVGRRSMPRAQPNGNPSHQGRRSGGRLVIGALPIIAILASALPASGQQMQREPLAIVTASGDVHSFEVEIARTPDEQARGLMFRRTLAPDAGMLFLHAKDGRQSMWMKNTLIPLDMLFIRRNGGISRIHERAIPRFADGDLVSWPGEGRPRTCRRYCRAPRYPHR